MRRFATKGTRNDLIVCAQLLRAAQVEEDRKALLNGFDQAFKGRPLPSLPEELVSALSQAGQSSAVSRFVAVNPARSRTFSPSSEMRTHGMKSVL
jgi:hypothetical protein